MFDLNLQDVLTAGGRDHSSPSFLLLFLVSFGNVRLHLKSSLQTAESERCFITEIWFIFTHEELRVTPDS